jgi:hypothetical protein
MKFLHVVILKKATCDKIKDLKIKRKAKKKVYIKKINKCMCSWAVLVVEGFCFVHGPACWARNDMSSVRKVSDLSLPTSSPMKAQEAPLF